MRKNRILTGTLVSLLLAVSLASALPAGFVRWGAWRTEDSHLKVMEGVDLASFDGRYSVSGHIYNQSDEFIGQMSVHFSGTNEELIHTRLLKRRVTGTAYSTGHFQCTAFDSDEIVCRGPGRYLVARKVREDGTMIVKIKNGKATVKFKDGSDLLLKVRNVPLDKLTVN